MKNCYLYKIVNKVNGKLYIGITSDPRKRKQRHFSKTGHSAVSLVRLAMDKYGRENFSFEIICLGSKEYILDLEVKAISLYRTCEKKFGYNIKPGGQSGAGYMINGSKKDTPVFVSGWWFPVRRVAIKALNITTHMYKNYQKNGTLGDIVRGKRGAVYVDGNIYSPVYVADFWFTNRKTAADKLGLPYSTVQNRIYKGFTGTKKGQKDQYGKNNNFFGVDPKDHPSSVAVIINDIKYDSIKQATEATGFSKYIINSRIKENHIDFRYA
jgi:group I intron endonuclease